MATRTQLQATVKTLQDLYSQEAELKETIKAHEQIIKDHMEQENIEHLDLGTNIVHWTQVISKVFDLKKFRADFGIVEEYMTDKMSRRFKVA